MPLHFIVTGPHSAGFITSDGGAIQKSVRGPCRVDAPMQPARVVANRSFRGELRAEIQALQRLRAPHTRHDDETIEDDK